jgi:predicted nucleic acid-binding protein
MKRIFVDTAYFVALVRKRDQLHRQATEFQENPPGELLTTEWVLTETADSLAEPPTREEFIRVFDRLRMRKDVVIVQVSHEHFLQGCELYAKRNDKHWSLTDCISFVVMREHRIDAALTSDIHFEQAGFQRLLNPGPQGVREPTVPPYGCSSQRVRGGDPVQLTNIILVCAPMKIDEILAEMPNLSVQELDSIRTMAHELKVKEIKQRLEKLEAEPWPRPRNPRWDAFLEWIESQPDDGLPEDFAHNHDRYRRHACKRP